jgi:hypothetical protein
MTRQRRGTRAGHQRVLEMLARLQLRLCGRCGRACYDTRRAARHAARIAAPGAQLRAYRCVDTWHLTSPPNRPQRITSPVTLAQDIRAGRAGLDREGAVKRAYRCSRPDQSASPQPAAHTFGRRSGPDPLADIPSAPLAPSRATYGGGR